jgi:hypothetical protein
MCPKEAKSSDLVAKSVYAVARIKTENNQNFNDSSTLLPGTTL